MRRTETNRVKQQSIAFENRKKQIERILQDSGTDDKSPKGFLDKPIVSLIHAINGHADYVTTSSCSGRIALFAEASDSFESQDNDDDEKNASASDAKAERGAVGVRETQSGEREQKERPREGVREGERVDEKYEPSAAGEIEDARRKRRRRRRRGRGRRGRRGRKR